MQGERLIRSVIGRLETSGVPYFVTGSVASAYYSEPRFTRDCDIVVHMSVAAASEFADAMRSLGFYASREAAMQAAARLSSFNVIASEEGFKVDVMVHEDDGYEGLRMQRRRRVTLLDNLPAWVASPEDVILKKLVFYREGGSEKHLRDIASMFKVRGCDIDRTYIESWAPRLGVLSHWRVVEERIDRAEPGPPQ